MDFAVLNHKAAKQNCQECAERREVKAEGASLVSRLFGIGAALIENRGDLVSTSRVFLEIKI